jgi:Leucine-rich repeat (LRR) protein
MKKYSRLLALLVMGQMGYTAQSDVIKFVDPNLEQAVRDALEIPAGQPITKADMARLTDLDASNRGIQNLSGLEYAINLQGLDLSFNQISDISPLANLTNLQFLHLLSNQISNISPLANLTNLQYLLLDSNQISDISPLISNTGLGQGDEVYLQNNPLDLTPGSDDMQNIQILQSRGVIVYY